MNGPTPIPPEPHNKMREQLLGHLLGALEPDERYEVERSLSDDPQLRVQLEEMRAQLAVLEAGREPYEPPLALAPRTCEMVAARPTLRSATLDEVAAPPSGRMRLIDMAVAASVFLAAAALFVPALSNSRYAAQLAQCQNNLRKIGQTLVGYAEANNGELPKVPAKGDRAAAGVYAPILAESGHPQVSEWIVCPASDLADQRDHWRMPSLSDLRAASGQELARLRQTVGGSYGYSLGYVENGRYYGPNTHNGAATYALMADSPSGEPDGRRGCNHLRNGQNVLYADGHVNYLVECHREGCPDNIYLNEQGMVAAGMHAGDAVIGHSSAQPIPWQGFEETPTTSGE